jgi:hypothetical protein
MLLAAMTFGCGPRANEKYPVSGVVRYRGNPLPLGNVTFVPLSGPVSGPVLIDPNGRYHLEAVAGRHAVGVVAMPRRTGGRRAPGLEGGMDWTGVPEARSLIPEKYNRYDTSGISATVEPQSANTLDIDLQ